MRHHNLDFLQNELSRVSQLIQFADQKAGFLGLFYSAIFGFIFTKRDDIYCQLVGQGYINGLYFLMLIVLFALLAVGIYHLFATVSPRLENSNAKQSLFYFANLARTEVDDCIKTFDTTTEEEARNQLIEQIHASSCIVNSKMTNVKKSTQVLMIVGGFVFTLFFFF